MHHSKRGNYGSNYSKPNRYQSSSSSYTHRNNSIQNQQTLNKQNVIYMGDLDYNWDENTIKDIWRQLGEASVKVRMIWNSNQLNNTSMNAQNKVNQGYCFVEFLSKEKASAAILKNGTEIPGYRGRLFKLNWSTGSGASSAKVQASFNKDGPSNDLSVFVGDLDHNVTESQLYDLFKTQYASTISSKIIYDPTTGTSKNYGFIKFSNPIDCRDALVTMQNKHLNGRAIKVRTVGNTESTQHRNISSLNQTHGSNTKVMPQARGSSNIIRKIQNKKNTTSLFFTHTQENPALNDITDPNNTTIIINNLPEQVTTTELLSFFKPFGEIITTMKDPVTRFTFITYIDRISAENSMKLLQGKIIRGCSISISWGRPLSRINIPQSQQLQHIRHPEKKSNIYEYIPSSSDLNPNTPSHPDQYLQKPIPNTLKLTFTNLDSKMNTSNTYDYNGPEQQSKLRKNDIDVLINDNTQSPNQLIDSLNRLENCSNGWYIS